MAIKRCLHIDQLILDLPAVWVDQCMLLRSDDAQEPTARLAIGETGLNGKVHWRASFVIPIDVLQNLAQAVLQSNDEPKSMN